MKTKLTISQQIYEKTRKNKQFIRFLKEHDTFKEYFRNIELFPFTTHQKISSEDEFIISAFKWDPTGDFYKWHELNDEWLIKQVYK